MKISLRILVVAICLMAGATSCSMLDRHKLEDRIDQLEHKMPKEITLVGREMPSASHKEMIATGLMERDGQLCIPFN